MRLGAVLLATFFASTVLAGTVFAGAVIAEVPEKLLVELKEQTVMITVTHRDGSVARGAGVVLCQRDGQAHALTSHHLLAAEMPDGRRVLRRPARTEIRFFADSLPPIVDDRANAERLVVLRQVPEQDAVLLTFPLGAGLVTAAATAVTWRHAAPLLMERTNPTVLSLGHGDGTAAWAHAVGPLLPGDGLRHSGSISEGFSGGPLYTETGTLLGINLRPGEALSILDVLPALGKWLPAECGRRLEMKAHPVLDSRDRWEAAQELVSGEKTVDPERLKELAVMITVTAEDGSVEQGAGVVLCQDDGQVHVLTARHVIGEAPRNTEIKFFHYPEAKVVDVSVSNVEDEDLALVTFPFAEALEWTAFLGPPGNPAMAGTAVVAVGFPRASATAWATEGGVVLAGVGESLRHSAAVSPGFSGGPLLAAETGAFLGVNVERIAGEAAGEALATEDVLPKIEDRLPVGCLRAREVQVKGLYQGVWDEAYSHVPPTLTMEAEKWLVWGWGDDFRIGNYEVEVEERGTGLMDSILKTRTKQHFRFSLEEDRDVVWKGKCVREFDVPVDLGIVEKFLDQRSELTCTAKPEKGRTSVKLELEEFSASKKETTGEVKVGDFEIVVTESKPVRLKKLEVVIPAGYFFYVDDRIVGAVDTLANDTVWLHPSLQGKSRSAFLVAVAALLASSVEARE